MPSCKRTNTWVGNCNNFSRPWVAGLSVVDLMQQGIICAATLSVSWALDSWAARLAVCMMSCLFITQGSPLCLPTICVCLLTVKLMKVWQCNFHSFQLCITLTHTHTLTHAHTHTHTRTHYLYLYLSLHNYINETAHLPANRFGLACFSLMGKITRNPGTNTHTQTMW